MRQIRYDYFCFPGLFKLYWKYMTSLCWQFSHSVCLWLSLNLKPWYPCTFSPLAKLQLNKADFSVDVCTARYTYTKEQQPYPSGGWYAKCGEFKCPEILRQTGTLPENHEKERQKLWRKLVVSVSSQISFELFPHWVTCELVVKAWAREFADLPSNLIVTRPAYLWTPAN